MTAAFARAEPIRLREWQSAWDGEYLTVDDRMSAARSYVFGGFMQRLMQADYDMGLPGLFQAPKSMSAYSTALALPQSSPGPSAIHVRKSSGCRTMEIAEGLAAWHEITVFRTASSGRSNAVFNVVRFMSVEKALPFTSFTDSACLRGSWLGWSAQRSTMDRSEEVATH